MQLWIRTGRAVGFPKVQEGGSERGRCVAVAPVWWHCPAGRWQQGCGISRRIRGTHPWFLAGGTGWKELSRGLWGKEGCLWLCMKGRAGGKAPSLPWGMSGGWHWWHCDFPGHGCPSNPCCCSPAGKTTLTKCQHLPNPSCLPLMGSIWASRTGFSCKPCLPLRIPAVLGGLAAAPPPGPLSSLELQKTNARAGSVESPNVCV